MFHIIHLVVLSIEFIACLIGEIISASIFSISVHDYIFHSPSRLWMADKIVKKPLATAVIALIGFLICVVASHIFLLEIL